ncbi:MAG: cbb3-type cytochrome c oxidase subunit II [Verrucomicrobia bacterium]|nr:cbb3-type cytochrome c oxidase subunit II [Verrucomicrobiota bacterium]
MKSLPILFLGIFFTLAFSWTGIVLVSHIQLGFLEPATPELTNAEEEAIAGVLFRDPDTGRMVHGRNQDGVQANPMPLVGSAQRGLRVYEQMGCLYCHSQQVRRQGFGSDFERGWGNRQSVPRDYILKERVMLGTMRTGPDLSNVGLRYSELWQHQHLYNPQITSPGSTMPPYAFLYEVRPINPVTGPSPIAIDLPAQWALPEGYELIPTRRALDLVAYLMSLHQDYELPEIKFTE